jgi:hypothetical protein
MQKRGVIIYSVPNLHAKVYAFDDVAFCRLSERLKSFCRNARGSHDPHLRFRWTQDQSGRLCSTVVVGRAEKTSKYCNLGDFDGGFYDCEFVVPWTISACNLNADLMIVAQDWASENFLTKRSKTAHKELRKLHGQDCDLQTNKNLKVLLKRHFEHDFSDTYATDVFVFIRPGAMSAQIPMEDLKYCAEA